MDEQKKEISDSLDSMIIDLEKERAEKNDSEQNEEIYKYFDKSVEKYRYRAKVFLVFFVLSIIVIVLLSLLYITEIKSIGLAGIPILTTLLIMTTFLSIQYNKNDNFRNKYYFKKIITDFYDKALDKEEHRELKGMFRKKYVKSILDNPSNSKETFKNPTFEIIEKSKP